MEDVNYVTNEEMKRKALDRSHWKTAAILRIEDIRREREGRRDKTYKDSLVWAEERKNLDNWKGKKTVRNKRQGRKYIKS